MSELVSTRIRNTAGKLGLPHLAEALTQYAQRADKAKMGLCGPARAEPGQSQPHDRGCPVLRQALGLQPDQRALEQREFACMVEPGGPVGQPRVDPVPRLRDRLAVVRRGGAGDDGSSGQVSGLAKRNSGPRFGGRPPLGS